MRFHCDGLLGVVLRDILVHLVDRQWLLVFIVAGQPQSGRLVVLIVGYVQIVGSGWNDFVLGVLGFLANLVLCVDDLCVRVTKRERLV